MCIRDRSTLINAISGIVKYKDGEIIYKDEKLPKQAHKIVKAGICQVPEGRVIFANLTVMENLNMGAFLRNDKDGIPVSYTHLDVYKRQVAAQVHQKKKQSK